MIIGDRVFLNNILDYISTRPNSSWSLSDLLLKLISVNKNATTFIQNSLCVNSGLVVWHKISFFVYCYHFCIGPHVITLWGMFIELQLSVTNNHRPLTWSSLCLLALPSLKCVWSMFGLSITNWKHWRISSAK